MVSKADAILKSLGCLLIERKVLQIESLVKSFIGLTNASKDELFYAYSQMLSVYVFWVYVLL